MEIELRTLIIRVLKESRSNLSPFEIFNYLISKNLILHSIRDNLEIEHIRKICKDLVYDGVLMDKGSGKYVFKFETETTKAKIGPRPKISQLGKQTISYLKNNIKKNVIIHQLDLILSVILVLFSIIFILIPPFNQTFIRILVALPLLLFLSGYSFILFVFPKQGELSLIERFTLSIGLSVAISVFDGFALNYTQWGYRPNSIVISLSIIISIFLACGYFQRWRQGGNAYDFSTIYSALRSKEIDTGTDYDPLLEKMLIKTMIIGIIIVSAMLIYAIITTEPEKFTTLYIIGLNGKAEDYPGEIKINSPTHLLVGIENHEYKAVNYTLRVQLDNRILNEQPVYLNHQSKWLDNVTFTPLITSSIALSKKEKKSKLEFILLKDNYPYRSVHLWVKPDFDINDFIPSVTLENSDMEQASGWNFRASNDNITGSFTNTAWTSSSHSYMINFTTNNSREWGEFSQNVTVDKESIATLSFYVNDSYSNKTSNIFKQVLVDRNVIWERGMGNNSWEKIVVPVFFSKNALLTFRVYNKIPMNETYQVWWDDIKIEKYNETSDISTPKPVMVPNYQLPDFKIRGMPVAMKGNVTIDGRGFPGFFYDIDENISYEQFDISFSDDRTIETGKAKYSSLPRDNEITILGSTYRIININNTANLSRVLMKDDVKTLNVNEKWILENGYSLTLKLVSSDGNTAMLELRKGNSTVNSKVVGEKGIFEYRAKIDKNTVTVFKTNVDSITSNSVKVTGTELYSDKATILKTGDSILDFEITNISSSQIIMENPNPINIEDNSLLLGGYIKFKVESDIAIPYAASGEIRGIPQRISDGETIKINGSNYPGFQYDIEDKVPLEELSISIDSNGTVDTGNAVYRSHGKGDELYFLGNSYWIPNPVRANMISRFSSSTNIIPKNGSIMLENGFTIFLKETSDDGIEIHVKGNITPSQKKLIDYLNTSKNSGILADYYYEMFTTTFKKGRIKSNIVYEAGDEFEYRIEYREDQMILLISGKLEEKDNSNVTMAIKTYQIPIELLPGMRIGEFEVEYFSQGNITVKNTKPLKFEPGTETPLMGDIIRIRASTKEPIIYPVKGLTK